jgi:hypothetical protein
MARVLHIIGIKPMIAAVKAQSAPDSTKMHRRLVPAACACGRNRQNMLENARRAYSIATEAC